MASGAFSSAVCEGLWRMGVSWTSTPNTSGNYSTLTATVYLQCGSTNAYVYLTSSKLTCTIDGKEYTATVNFGHKEATAGTKITLATITSSQISHNADGTKTTSIKASIDTIYSNGATYSNQWVSGSCKLDTIARCTTPTLSTSNLTLGNSLTITTTSINSSYTHNLTYTVNGTTGTIATGVKASYTWASPLSIANYIPDAESATMTITCTTYNGSTALGSKTVTLVAAVPSTVVPTISNIATSDPKGYVSTFSGYVQNKSTLKVVVTASGSYSSTIKSYSITANGVTYTSGATITTNPLKTAGTNTISVTVTDSRGRKYTKTASITVYEYAPPKITALSAYRCLSDGTADEDGAYMKVTVGASISAVGNYNTKTFKLEYKPTSITSYRAIKTWTSEYSVATSVIVSITTDNSYNIKLAATDYFTTIESVIDLATSFTLLDFNATGKGIAFGKVSEQDAFECALPAIFSSVKTSAGGNLDTATSGLLSLNTSLNTVNTTLTTHTNSKQAHGGCRVVTTTATSKIKFVFEADRGTVFITVATNGPRTSGTYVFYYESSTYTFTKIASSSTAPTITVSSYTYDNANRICTLILTGVGAWSVFDVLSHNIISASEVTS